MLAQAQSTAKHVVRGFSLAKDGATLKVGAIHELPLPHWWNERAMREKKDESGKKYYKTLPDLPCGGLDKRGTIVLRQGGTPCPLVYAYMEGGDVNDRMPRSGSDLPRQARNRPDPGT